MLDLLEVDSREQGKHAYIPMQLRTGIHIEADAEIIM
jgi:hypothetical protein